MKKESTTPAAATTTTATDAAPLVTNPNRLIASGMMFASQADIAREQGEAARLLMDPATADALWQRIRLDLLTDAAVYENRWRVKVAAEKAAADAAERQRLDGIAHAQSVWRNARVENESQAIEFFMTVQGWSLTAMKLHRDSAGARWLAMGNHADRHGESLDTGILTAEGLIGHFTDARNHADKLAVDVRQSRILVLRGLPGDLDKFGVKFALPVTLAWSDPDGMVNKVFTRFNGCYTGTLYNSVELTEADVLPIPPTTGCKWSVGPAEFGESMAAEQTGLPSLPGELVTLLKDLAGASNRQRFITAMID